MSKLESLRADFKAAAERIAKYARSQGLNVRVKTTEDTISLEKLKVGTDQVVDNHRLLIKFLNSTNSDKYQFDQNETFIELTSPVAYTNRGKKENVAVYIPEDDELRTFNEDLFVDAAAMILSVTPQQIIDIIETGAPREETVSEDAARDAIIGISLNKQ